MTIDNRFGTMRRKDRCLSKNEAWEILEKGMSGTLSVNGPEGYPYGVPMNYAISDDRILFHATSAGGLLTDSLSDDDRACFTVTEWMGGSRSRSAIVFGKVSRDDSLLDCALESIIDKYVPEEGRRSAKAGIPKASERAIALVMTVESISAKVVDKPEGR